MEKVPRGDSSGREENGPEEVEDRRRGEEGRRREDDGVANMAAPESETKPCRGRARLRRDAVVVVVDVDGDGDGDRVTAAALGDQYLDASGERRDAERRRIASRRERRMLNSKSVIPRVYL